MDREQVLATLDDELAALGNRPRLLVLTGVGGIGKSRLLHELRLRAVKAKIAAATIKLQEPAQRTQLSGLASLRAQLGEFKVHFDRFDVGYAVWWQRLNPQVQLSADRLAFANSSEVLTSVLNDVSGVPVFGTAVKVMESRRAASSGGVLCEKSPPCKSSTTSPLISKPTPSHIYWLRTLTPTVDTSCASTRTRRWWEGSQGAGAP